MAAAAAGKPVVKAHLGHLGLRGLALLGSLSCSASEGLTSVASKSSLALVTVGCLKGRAAAVN